MDDALKFGSQRLISRAGAVIRRRADEVGTRTARGPIAQAGQCRRLITGRSQVRILVGPLSPSREKNALG